MGSKSAQQNVAIPTDQQVSVVDADVHPVPRAFDELIEFLPNRYQGQGWVKELSLDPSLYLTPTVSRGVRGDSLPEDGSPAASDPDLLEEQLLKDAGVDIAIFVPLVVHSAANPEHAAALCSAANSWLAETWLGDYNSHGRYRGSISVPSSHPEAAAAEIEKWSEHPYFVQVLLDPYLGAPLGQRQYRSIHEAAARTGLPLALHINRDPGMPLLSPVGFPSYYAEHHPLYSLVYLPHVVSLITEGVFEDFPELKLVVVEGGSAWLGPLKWRMDHFWREYGEEVPWLKKAPSQYFKDHIRVTSQPIEEPTQLSHFHAYLKWMDAENTLLYSSDYPHWDFDAPDYTIGRMPEAIRERVMYGNSIEVYGLPESVSALGPA